MSVNTIPNLATGMLYEHTRKMQCDCVYQALLCLPCFPVWCWRSYCSDQAALRSKDKVTYSELIKKINELVVNRYRVKDSKSIINGQKTETLQLLNTTKDNFHSKHYKEIYSPMLSSIIDRINELPKNYGTASASTN